MNLNPDEKKVLVYLVEEGGYWGFAGIGEVVSRLDRKTIRRACRSLKRKGLTEFKSGLWFDDGGMAGSGYKATDAGHKMIALMGRDHR
jgi:hypothetical protein